MDVLAGPDQQTGAYRFVARTAQVPVDSLHDLSVDPGPGRRLEKGQIVETVILVINNRITRDLGMGCEPREDLVAPRFLGQIRQSVDEGHPPVLGGQESDRIKAPGRGQYDLRARSFE